MKELVGGLETVEEVLAFSKARKKIGVSYNDDVCSCDLACCFREGNIPLQSGSDFEKNVVLDEGYYVEDCSIYSMKGFVHIFSGITAKYGLLEGYVKIGTYGGIENLYMQAPVFEDEEHGILGKNIYVFG